MMIDINPYHLEIVTQILHEHVPDCEVRAFGSRATWTSKEYSDLDLAIVGNGPLKWRTLGKLRDAFEESYLPFRVDVLDWHDISDNFRKIIEVDCITVLESEKITNSAKLKWPMRKFGDCATLIRASVDPSSVSDSPYIGLEHIGEGTLSLLDHGVASDVTSTKTLFKQGDILFGKLRPYFRKVIRAPFDGICSTDIWTVRANEGIDQVYLYYCMASQPFVDFATSGSIGTRMPRAKWEYVSQYNLPVPTLSKQQEIAHILESLDNKIELNRRLNETLEAMAQTLFKSWFVDFDPVRAKVEGRWRPGESLPGLPAHLYDLFPDRLVPSELGDIPEGWQIGVLDDIVQLLSGGTPNTEVSQYWDGEIPWYTARDAPSTSDIFVISTKRTVTPAGVQNSPTKILPAKTTIISARGTVGTLALLSMPMAMNQTCYGLRGSRSYSDFYTYWTVRSTVDEIQKQTHGTIFDTITRSTFKLIKIVIPYDSTVKQFESTIFSIMESVLRNLYESSNMITLLDSISPKLFANDLTIRSKDRINQ